MSQSLPTSFSFPKDVSGVSRERATQILVDTKARIDSHIAELKSENRILTEACCTRVWSLPNVLAGTDEIQLSFFLGHVTLDIFVRVVEERTDEYAIGLCYLDIGAPYCAEVIGTRESNFYLQVPIESVPELVAGWLMNYRLRKGELVIYRTFNFHVVSQPARV